MFKQRIEQDLKRVIDSLGFETTDIVLTIPENDDFGDYSSNIPLQLAKQKSKKVYQSPLEIANDILQKFGHPAYLERVEVAGVGFINFFIKREKLAQDLKEILDKKEKFGMSDKYKGKSARVEYLSVNPTGPLHIGNARGGPLGDVIANVLENVGYEVLREYIHNDVGVQVQQLGLTIKALVEDNLTPEHQYQGGYVKELAQQLKNKISGKSNEQIGKMAVDILFEEIMADIMSMAIKFDLIVKESDLRKGAEAVLGELKLKGVIREKDGAQWFAPSDQFLKDRETVVKKSNGEYTYFTADIVYHKLKFESGANLVIDVFGSNHHGHVPRLQAVVTALGFDPRKLKFILYQWVRVKRGDEIIKMSKRAGTFITAKEVLDEVGVDAFRFWLLRFSTQTHMDFDLDLLKEQSSKNPVYYVQYAHARMCGILQKSGHVSDDVDLSLLIQKQEADVIKHLLIYPDLVEKIAKDFQVHQLTDYAISLADLINKFYESSPVLTAQGQNLKKARVSLVYSSQIVLANVLRLLGVSAPSKM